MATREMTSQFPDFRRRFAQQMADYADRVAGNVTRVRIAAGYDREPFAYKAGISPRQLKRIEDGLSHPRRATIRKVARAAGVHITEIAPDLDADEDELRDQLDRIEEKLDEILRRIRADDQPGEGDDPPTTLPDDPDRPPGSQDADEPESGTGE